MANPFGSNDETLAVNGQHVNAGNLIHAVIPRTASKIVEVVSAGAVTNLNGNYNSDGYWHPGTTTRTDVIFNIASPWAVGTNHTVIAGWYRDNNAGTPDFTCTAGPYRDAQVAHSLTRNSTDGLTAYAAIRDNAYQSGPTGTAAISANGAYAIAVKNTITAGSVQSGFRRLGSTNTTFSNTTYTLGTGTLDKVNILWVGTASRYPFQYLFVYDAALSDSDINAIIDDPGAVLMFSGLSGVTISSGAGTHHPVFAVGL